MRHGGAVQDTASVIRQRIEGAGAHGDIEPTWL